MGRKKDLPLPSALERLVQSKKAKGEKLPNTKVEVNSYKDSPLDILAKQLDYRLEPHPAKEIIWEQEWFPRPGGLYYFNGTEDKFYYNGTNETEPKSEVDEWLDEYLEGK